MSTCVIYARISLDRTGEEAGVDRQLKECRELAEQRGLTVQAEYVDNDISATTGKPRPQFEALLASKPEAIVAWHQDRLLRTGKDIERVIDLKVNVYMVTAGTLDLSTPAGRAVARTIAAWSQYEGEQKAERQKSQNRQRAAKGLPRNTARRFGYEADGINPRPDEADAIRKAYEDFLNGKSIHAVVREWNDAGIKPIRADRWTTAAVRQVMKRPRNAGLLIYDGTPQEDSQIVPIVTREQFDLVQAVFAHPDRATGKRGPKVVKNWLTGLITCSLCGAPMIAHKGYYVCGNTDRPKGERHVAIATHLAEDEAKFVLFTNLQWERERIESTNSAAVQAIRAESAEHKRQRQEWQEQATWPGADKVLIRQKVAELTAKIDELEVDLAAATTDGATTELMRHIHRLDVWEPWPEFSTFKDHFDSLSVDEKRAVFSLIPTPRVTKKVAGVQRRLEVPLRGGLLGRVG